MTKTASRGPALNEACRLQAFTEEELVIDKSRMKKKEEEEDSICKTLRAQIFEKEM